MNKKLIYKEVLEEWGMDNQLTMMVEECAELIQAIQKFSYRGGPIKNVVEELADVEIMCEQMRLIFNPITIDLAKKLKLIRLETLLCR